VLADSTPLKGTEGGGGVAYAPWINSYFAYAAPIYYQPAYYSYPYYPYYSYSYYYPSYPYYPYASYSTPYYGSSYYYAPSRSYYYGGYGSYYGGYYGDSSRERYTWSTPPETVATPRVIPPRAPMPSAPGAAKGFVVPKP
jgi:hypothetical protein